MGASACVGSQRLWSAAMHAFFSEMKSRVECEVWAEA